MSTLDIHLLMFCLLSANYRQCCWLFCAASLSLRCFAVCVTCDLFSSNDKFQTPSIAWNTMTCLHLLAQKWLSLYINDTGCLLVIKQGSHLFTNMLLHSTWQTPLWFSHVVFLLWRLWPNPLSLQWKVVSCFRDQLGLVHFLTGWAWPSAATCCLEIICIQTSRGCI